MPAAIIVHPENYQKAEFNKVLSSLEDWTLYFVPFVPDHELPRIDMSPSTEIHFVIISVELNNASQGELKKLKKKYPFAHLIYYYPTLRNVQYLKLIELNVNSCIVGQCRQTHLIEALEILWKNHWKRIPEFLSNINPNAYSPRAKKVIRYIENTPIKRLKLKSLAANLNISENYLKSEFKNLFSINFRSFKQQLVKHYESILLFDKKLKPGMVHRILDYNNVSNFSRSFKARHGSTWRERIQVENPLDLSGVNDR